MAKERSESSDAGKETADIDLAMDCLVREIFRIVDVDYGWYEAKELNALISNYVRAVSNQGE